LAAGLAPAAASAGPPAALVPPPPFPVVLASSAQREAVAPGIFRTTYRLKTAAGPLVVSVVSVNTKDPRVHVGTVLANDTILSSDETVSSMARRTRAVAGINGDYFDIDASGAPLGMLVHDGTLERSPSARVALTIAGDGTVRFERYGFSGTLSGDRGSLPLTGVNVWPPQAGASLLTPAFGLPPATPGVTLLSLSPFFADPAPGRFRVDAITAGPPFPAPGMRIALPPGTTAPADVGDVVSVIDDTTPPLAGARTAIGGGPLLLRAGVPVDDPSSPNYAERNRRIPAAAAARLADGTLALVVVDGRRPVTSIGVTRAELSALLLGLGAVDAMLFDSGGSATLVARARGDVDATLVNDPSDGLERRVADGLFAYSDVAVGPPAQLVVRPDAILALPGARIPLTSRVVDAADHPLGDARGTWILLAAGHDIVTIDHQDVLHVGRQLGAHKVAIARGSVQTILPIEIIPRATRVVVGPAQANPDAGATLQLTAQAFDERDRLVAIDGLARWHATAGARIDERGRLTVGERDAVVTVTAGDVHAEAVIPVGRHTATLPLGDPRHPAWKLVTVPANGPGALNVDERGLTLDYDFSAGGRAAFAIGDLPLANARSLSCAFDGDANGEAVRATLVDRYGERATATFVRALSFTGTRRLGVDVPPSLAPPLVLHALYVVGTLANPALTVAGAVGVHDCTLVVPGSQIPAG